MIVLPWQKGNSFEVLALFDNKIPDIASALQASDLGGEQAEVILCAAKEA